ncbi:MAG: hypothetical protein HDR50_06850 [Desulfovibrio sp.]|uniref:hypothetical protein n=1 Tax=Desulfovibrio sp. TaxID=885 RepID=UPI001A6FCBE7|nr:hypothetical protein [Desulfovibrio sp.]MBD5417366.1 hypothetical protein [Desulfovibrio sp.]
MALQAPKEEGLDTIKASPAYLKQLRACRKALPKEAQRCGRELAERLSKVFYQMKGALFQGHGIVLNEATLVRASISFWEDILRVKAYHPIDRAEKHKKAAYIFKWIARMRPVKPLVDNPDRLTSAEMNANAMFAFLCACGYLNCRRNLDEEEIRRILYSATYRDVSADEWAIIFGYVELVHPDDNPA